MTTTPESYAALARAEALAAGTGLHGNVLAPPVLKESVLVLSGLVLVLAQRIDADGLGGSDVIGPTVTACENLIASLTL